MTSLTSDVPHGATRPRGAVDTVAGVILKGLSVTTRFASVGCLLSAVQVPDSFVLRLRTSTRQGNNPLLAGAAGQALNSSYLSLLPCWQRWIGRGSPPEPGTCG